MKKNIYIIALALIITPLPAFAARTLRDIIAIIIGYLSVAIYLIIALAVVTFIWNVYRYFFTDKDKKEAGMYVLYSTIGFFVILSFWGLVYILMNSLNLPNQRPNFPFFSGYSSGTTQQSSGISGPSGINNGISGPSGSSDCSTFGTINGNCNQ